MRTCRSVVLTILLCTMVLTSCKNSNSPQAVTEKFLNSFVKMDYEAAKSVSTKNTWGLLDIWASFSSQIPEEVKQKRIEEFRIKITETRKESDTTMLVTYVTEPKMLPFNQLRLLQEKDIEGNIKWKVDISTLDLVGGDEMYIEEEKKAVEEEPTLPQTDTAKPKK
jgi:hypothetical protein